MTGPGLGEVIHGARVVVCCGTGGVGKTTVAAALAVGAARSGRRVALVTIDPARRLADAMGLDGISDEGCTVTGIPGLADGALWATMLDTKTTFDNLIVRHAAGREQADRILTNSLYRNLSSTLSGTREYMAMEKLYELWSDERFDLVVVDTPPSRHALDFLDAPDRLGRFLDGRLFRMAVPGSRVMRTVSAPLLAFLRRVAKVVSPEVVDDIFAFLEAFAGMEEGFRQRARATDEVLRGPSAAYVLVTAPGHDALEESAYLLGQLRSSGLTLDAVVVNRMHPSLVSESGDELASRAPRRGVLVPYFEAAVELARLAEEEAEAVAELLAGVPEAAVVRVPLLDHDVHDLDAIVEIEALLAG